MIKIGKDSPITFVEMPATQFGILYGDASHDVYSRFRLPSRSIPSLEAVVMNVGCRNVLSINPVYNGNGGKLSPANQDRIKASDVLCVSSITRTAPQSLDLIRRYKAERPDGVVLAGGPDPTFRHNLWRDAGTDVVVLGEARGR